VSNLALAQSLSLNPATVLEMVRKLKEKKLVALSENKSIQLTEKGRKKALIIIRKHRLWEVFLVEKLKYKWNEVHILAEQLEHIDSNEMVDRLEAFLGFPGYDPHGDPIPDKNGKIKTVHTTPLAGCQPGIQVKVISFAETNDAFLDYLEKLNIMPGTKIKIQDMHEYDQSYTVIIQKKTVQLSEKAARNILVETTT
jgi:DtxR family Mn-dependent transcriptional regulator